MTNQDTTLQGYYDFVQERASLRTPDHARRWSSAVLRTMGFNMSGGTRKSLSRELPEELGRELSRGFKLLSFFDGGKSADEFFKEVSRRSGNSDPHFARTATTAIFGGLKRTIDADLSRQVGNSLPREVGRLWNEA
jgi:uncharacterized protein (DUF2267 family)